ncbi:TIGR01244 family phosphatase [Ensifer sp. T173]|uniref:TIGR01244 family phosphatase n=1 Tax=Ensifer canadensis TaxID=555315 RepID=A0AAW4FXC6_9HYPH|nr:bifunctional sulfur transferase/dioxygenase Blh [Ensifer canadensis]MBM3096141.1 TIGR01244 family phosphatase [Ensifer canadensis]UBI79944.1 TIGR01244 family phosphatase [Ensifer canadensis]
MIITKVNEKLSIMAQPATDEFQSFADQGFTGLINVRPDGEDEEQPGSEQEAAAAKKARMSYTFIPVTLPTVTESEVAAFQEALDEAEGPVVAHCKSGRRALHLYAIGEVLAGRMRRSEVQEFGHLHGFDLTEATAWLENHFAQRPNVRGFFDERTCSIQYVVSDPETGSCAIIDPVLDYDEKAGAIGAMNANAILQYVNENALSVEWILDTHPHADHFSAAYYLAGQTGAPIAIGDRIVEVQKIWRTIYEWPDLSADGSHWNRLFADGETFNVGSIDARVLYSPGHTPASVTYIIGDAVFVHDTILMPDSGTARTDFPGGDASSLWQSIQRILALPEASRVFTGHDYQAHGRAPRWESTVAEQKRTNIHLDGFSLEDFVKLRVEKDAQLPLPKLILHALQVNLRAGRLPEPGSDGRPHLKIPIGAFDAAAWR